MNYNEVLENAKKALEGRCSVCKDCNGKACAGQIPGVGGKGSGLAFQNNRDFFKKIKIKMNCVYEAKPLDTSINLFNHTFKYPFFIAPIGGMALNYTGYLKEDEYAMDADLGALDAGICAWTGDGPQDTMFPSTLPALEAAQGMAIATIKPWTNDKIIEKIRMIEKLHAIGFAVDVDSCGLINLKLLGKPVNPKPMKELKEIAEATKLPFVVKGILTPEAALDCVQAGVYGIVISNHGGRVLEDAPAAASMIEAIRATVGNTVKIFVDGGIRTGSDVYKCLALGADAVLIGRPFVIATHGGGREGVKLYAQKIGSELEETMLMSGCNSLKDIKKDKIIIYE